MAVSNVGGSMSVNGGSICTCEGMLYKWNMRENEYGHIPSEWRWKE